MSGHTTFWSHYLFGRNDATTTQNKHRSQDIQQHIKVLEERINSLYLLNLAALELLQESGTPRHKIEEKIEEIDLRDGSKDGKLAPATHCPDCGHRVSKKRANCFFCGSKVNTFDY